MGLGNDKKCYIVSDTCGGIPYLKQVAVLWSLMAVLVVTMDLLSFAGLLPFPGGYTFPVIAFLYFTLGPRMCSIIATLGNCLTPAVLFLLMNVMIVAILLSSGCFSRDDMSSFFPSSEQAPAPCRDDVEHQVVPIGGKSRSLTRSSSDTGTGATTRVKTVKKVKRQHSAPSPSRSRLRDEVEEDEKELCCKEEEEAQQQQWHQQQQQQQQHHSSSLIIMELPSEAAAAAGHGGKAAAPSSYSSNLMTCDQDVFNEIIGNYIDKFKQDMRQQEMIPARCW